MLGCFLEVERALVKCKRITQHPLILRLVSTRFRQADRLTRTLFAPLSRYFRRQRARGVGINSCSLCLSARHDMAVTVATVWRQVNAEHRVVEKQVVKEFRRKLASRPRFSCTPGRVSPFCSPVLQRALATYTA